MKQKKLLIYFSQIEKSWRDGKNLESPAEFLTLHFLSLTLTTQDPNSFGYSLKSLPCFSDQAKFLEGLSKVPGIYNIDARSKSDKVSKDKESLFSMKFLTEFGFKDLPDCSKFLNPWLVFYYTDYVIDGSRFTKLFALNPFDLLVEDFSRGYEIKSFSVPNNQDTILSTISNRISGKGVGLYDLNFYDKQDSQGATTYYCDNLTFIHPIKLV